MHFKENAKCNFSLYNNEITASAQHCPEPTKYTYSALQPAGMIDKACPRATAVDDNEQVIVSLLGETCANQGVYTHCTHILIDSLSGAQYGLSFFCLPCT